MAIRILYIITKLELGGAQKNVLDILNRLDEQEFEAHLIASGGPLSADARRACSRTRIVRYLRRALDPFFDLVAFFCLARYMRRHKIQIVHTHSSKAGILGRWAAAWAGVPVIIHTVHGWGFHDYVKSFFNDLYIFLERKTARFTHALIAVTQYDIHKGLEHGIGEPGQYVLIRCGTDAPVLKNADVYRSKRRQLGLAQDDLVAVMVACFKPQKNPLDFVLAAARIVESCPRAKFLLIGDGVLRTRLEREIENRGLQESVFILGWRRDVEDILPVADVLVQTSLWEGLPLAILEAMRFARPVVAYDVCGLNEAVSDGVSGFLVPAKDTEALSEKVLLLFSDEALRFRMGRFGQHMMSQESFSLDGMMERLEGLYLKKVKG